MTDESTNSAEEVLRAARAKGLTLATAESCTGGLVSGALTDVAGSSDVFACGYVTYSYASKSRMLGVPKSMLEQHGAVSEPVAIAMAKGAQKDAGVDIAVSITGVAGPGASEAKPEGMVWFAAAFGQEVISELKTFGPLGRKAVRQASVDHALSMFQNAISEI